MNNKIDKYKDGINMEQFQHIKKLSCYNHNYYIGLKGNKDSAYDLLFGESDDDNETEWWIICGEHSVLLGYSYCSNGEKLVKNDKRHT